MLWPNRYPRSPPLQRPQRFQWEDRQALFLQDVLQSLFLKEGRLLWCHKAGLLRLHLHNQQHLLLLRYRRVVSLLDGLWNSGNTTGISGWLTKANSEN